MSNSKFILFISLILCQLTSFSQTTWEYTYDNAGNRTRRQVVEMRKHQAGQPADSTPTVQTLAEMEVGIMPNPVAGALKVVIANLPQYATGFLRVMDLQSHVIYYTEVIAAENRIDLSAQPAGAYILQVNVNGKKAEWKVVKN